MSPDEFRQYEEYRNGAPMFDWLPEFERIISNKLNARFMPTWCIAEKYVNDSGEEYTCYKFRIMLYSEEKFRRMPNNFNAFLVKALNTFVESTHKPNLQKSDRVECSLYDVYTRAYLEQFIFSKIEESEDKIKLMFDVPGIVDIHIGRLSYCKFSTKEQAKAFMLSDKLPEIRKRIYNLVKQYDEHDVLKPEHIRLFAGTDDSF